MTTVRQPQAKGVSQSVAASAPGTDSAEVKDMSFWRREIHKHPELAFEEVRTSEFVAQLLTEWGIEIHRGLAKTAVVGVIRGKKGNSKRAIALRADMDALMISEATGKPYASCHDGKMHACGHDGHTAMLLGAARRLAETRDFDGTVYVVFQPAEERYGGAKTMVEEGFFEKFPCDAIFGLHNWPGLASGKMAICEGPITAASDEIKFTLTGKGGHAAMPHRNIDVVTAASALVMSLQTLVSRNTDPLDSAVISVCKFQTGNVSLNVMPEQVELGGTVRTFQPETRNKIEAGIRRMVDGIAASYGIKAEFSYKRGYPSVINTPEETELAAKAAGKVVGEGHISRKFTPTTGAEDFAYFLQACPGAYIILGQGEERASLHSPHYDFNDETLKTGADYWCALVRECLEK